MTQALNDSFLFASTCGTHISWLAHALRRTGTVVPVALDAHTLDERIAALRPRAVFLDFSDTHAAAATEAYRQLRRDWPGLPMLGTGPSTQPAALMSALRAGVDDFVDTTAADDSVITTLAGLLARTNEQLAGQRGRTIALLGARAGLGVTTLATSLALLLQDTGLRTAAQTAAPRRGTALLDLGLPARDGLLYLDTASDFSFVDGVHNLRRLDQTLVHTAFARHSGGMSVLPLPASLTQVREISHADSAALITRLGDFFDYQVADLGGFTTIDFIAQTVMAADTTWVVCDQSVGAIVSTANMLKELAARGLDPVRFGLVVNQFDPNGGMSARDIAGRLRLQLAHMLPVRRSAHLSAASRGELLVRVNRNDPYSIAVQAMVKSLQRAYGTPAAASPGAPESAWSGFMSQLTGRRKAARES